jgi:NADH:ubiquinone oxidoreductase subunit E
MSGETCCESQTELDSILSGYPRDRGSMIPLMQDVQEELGYLPADAMERMAEHLNVPVSDIYGVATFYATFSLEPQGEHVISVCMGTACHVKGAPRILEALRRELNLHEDQETTDDLQFTVKSVRCIGCCGLAPAITVDDDTRGLLTPDDIPDILAEYE